MQIAKQEAQKVVFIVAINSDFGIFLSKRFSLEGFLVTGTYRSKEQLDRLDHIPSDRLFHCDISNAESVKALSTNYANLGYRWDIFISCVGYPIPLISFFGSDFDEWSTSFNVNCVHQFRVLHTLHSRRNSTGVCHVVFFAGGGTNGPVINFSAYTLSKITLIKMCEFLDAENPDLNVFIVGPGWTKTKTHDLILSDQRTSAEKRKETTDFLSRNSGTPMDHIYDCIKWCSAKGKQVVGGRNISVVHDRWGTFELEQALLSDTDMYKLRRYGNDWKKEQVD